MNQKTQSDQTNVEVLLELYRQACINAREYIDLRYKRFAIFVAITAIIGAATFEISDLHAYHAYVGAFGILNTVLFWLLDYRTQTFYIVKRNRLKACEKLLGAVQHFIPETDEMPGIPISVVMHLIFAMILLGWLTLEGLFIFANA